MDSEGIVAQVEAAVESQLRLTGEDSVLSEAADALLGALQPALRDAVMRVAVQAAAEVSAQLPDHTVDVVLSEGEPSLVVRDQRESVTVSTDDLEARMTVRLPSELKEYLEIAAGEEGDSVNTFVIKTLSTKKRKKNTEGKFKGTIRT